MSETGTSPIARPGLAGVMTAVLSPLAVMVVFIWLASLIRPLIPPDETRYLTVAWEMWERHNFIVPTLNFAPYHQKPPMLFWMIDLAWAIFGVSRYAALVAITLASGAVVLVTRALALELFPADRRIADRVCWLMVGNVVFAVYCGLVMFDLMLTALTAAAVLALLVHARRPSRWTIAAAGLAAGFAALTKGPVVLFFLAPIALSYPLWKGERYTLARNRFWKACGWALIVAFIPVLLWLVPLFYETGFGFMRALIWKQAAGRVTGTVETAHSRPFWFYLALLPLFFMPWIFSIHAWKEHGPKLRRPTAVLGKLWRSYPQVRLIVLAIVSSIALFSLVSGKAPHYIEPLLPIMTIAMAFFLANVSFRLIWITTVVTLAVFIIGEGIAALTIFPVYDLTKAARFVAPRDGHLGVVGKYHGEFGFLARLTKPVDEVDDGQAEAWLKAHPRGTLIGLELPKDKSLPGRTVFEMTYRSTKKKIIAVVPATSP